MSYGTYIIKIIFIRSELITCKILHEKRRFLKFKHKLDNKHTDKGYNDYMRYTGWCKRVRMISNDT